VYIYVAVVWALTNGEKKEHNNEIRWQREKTILLGILHITGK
jgi:hypothetical protein